MKNLINKKKYLKNQEGFTLIEIIAVIVILGIMAAVAVPKFFSMQDEAAKAVIQGALSEGAVRFNHAFAKFILLNQATPGEIADLTTGDSDGDFLTTVGATGVDVGDFALTWTDGSGLSYTDADGTSATAPDGSVLVSVLSCTTITTTTFDAMLAEDKQKIITNIDWHVAATP